ncbi:MAG: hypothetical protein AB8G17_04775 [Gammaproteobacteria bacterium]
MSIQDIGRFVTPGVHKIAVVTAFFLAVTGLLCSQSSHATTIVPLDLNQVVEQSDLIFEGKVIDLQIEATGVDIKSSKAKAHVAPALPAQKDTSDDENSVARPPYADAQAPVGLGVEGGRMLFTRVTMLVDRDIGGGLSASTVTFKVAGGVEGDTEVSVAGMPRFELDQRYVVFLRDDYTRGAVPIVGVNQGFFKVVSDENGMEQLLTHGGDLVIGIENDELVVRHNPHAHSRIAEQPEPAPVPSAGSNVQVEASPQVARYFSSTEPPMAIAEFARSIRAVKEAQK